MKPLKAFGFSHEQHLEAAAVQVAGFLGACSMADYGHTEPKRGAEWWGKSVCLLWPGPASRLLQSEPPSGRNQ
ncbi:putative lipoprotein [Pseudomonas synxantha BG33R]|nr:putative lipoprotein [Pseudomonas synxantha BG33R]